jgi:hypothetical protein
MLTLLPGGQKLNKQDYSNWSKEDLIRICHCEATKLLWQSHRLNFSNDKRDLRVVH